MLHILEGKHVTRSLLSVLVLFIGTISLMGWIFHLPLLSSWLPDAVTMKCNTSLSFMALGLALWFHLTPPFFSWQPRVVQGLAGFILTLGGLSLLEYGFGSFWSLDHFIVAEAPGAPFTSHPGRMAPTTGLAFILLSLFILLETRSKNHSSRVWLILPVFLIGCSSLLGYWYGSGLFLGFTKMAFPTGLGLTISSGLLLHDAAPAWLRQPFAETTDEAHLLRRVLLAASIISILFGKILLSVVERGWFGLSMATLLFIVVGLSAFFGMTFWQYHSLVSHRTALEKTRTRFRLLFENSSDAIMTLTPPAWRFSEANPATIQMFRADSKEAFLACEPWRLSPAYQPDGSPSNTKANALIQSALERGSLLFEWIHTRFDGQPFNATVLLSRVDDGDTPFLQATVRDITSQKKNEEELLQLRKAVYSSEEIIFMTDPEGLITFVNPQFSRSYGYAPEDVIGKVTPRILKGGEMTREFYQNFWARLKQGQPVKTQLINRTKHGEKIPVEVTVNAIPDERGAIIGFVAIQRDITERRALEDRFQQSQRMEVIGQLAGGVAHDFNNLLTPILGYAQLMRESLTPASPLLEDLSEIEKAGNRAAHLTRQLLAFSRKQALQPQPLNLSAWLQEESKTLHRMIGEHIALSMTLATQLDNIKVDPGQMAQILYNLTLNARDAMLNGGTLEILTENVLLRQEDFLDPNEGWPGAYVKWTIRDSGCGMSPDVKRKLFEPFFTTKEKGKGTGLGLASVHGIVKQSDGLIHVHSEEGHGAEFQLFFPAYTGDVRKESPALRPPVISARAHTILLVEDEEGVRQLCARVLRQQGHTVLEAGNGVEGLQQARAHPGPLSLVISDNVMPQMGGMEMTEQLIRDFPHIKVLMISGFQEDAEEVIKKIHPYGLLLKKPFSPEVLIQETHRLLNIPAL